MCAPTMDTACCLHNELSLHYTGENSLSHCYTIWILRVKVILICLCICLTSNSIIPEYKISKYVYAPFFSPLCRGRGVNRQDTRTRRHRGEMSITLPHNAPWLPTLHCTGLHSSIAGLRELRSHKNVRVIVSASALGRAGDMGLGSKFIHGG